MLPEIKRSQNAGSCLCAAAQRAYAASRPPYEQIEVLAGAFPDLDSDIDARCWCCGLTREGRLPQTLHAWHFGLLLHLPTRLLAHLSVLLRRSASPTAWDLLPQALRVHRWRGLQQRDGGTRGRQGVQGAQLARRPPCMWIDTRCRPGAYLYSWWMLELCWTIVLSLHLLHQHIDVS